MEDRFQKIRKMLGKIAVNTISETLEYKIKRITLAIYHGERGRYALQDMMNDALHHARRGNRRRTYREYRRVIREARRLLWEENDDFV